MADPDYRDSISCRFGAGLLIAGPPRKSSLRHGASARGDHRGSLAADQPCQQDDTRKTDHCLGSYAPAGFLNDVVHDVLTTAGPSSRAPARCGRRYSPAAYIPQSLFRPKCGGPQAGRCPAGTNLRQWSLCGHPQLTRRTEDAQRSRALDAWHPDPHHHPPVPFPLRLRAGEGLVDPAGQPVGDEPDPFADAERRGLKGIHRIVSEEADPLRP